MSGHSHAKKVKHQKEATAAQRSKVFSKLASEITIATRSGGKDPTNNPRLRAAMEKAREVNMPSDNVERAIRRGTGEDTGQQLEELLLEALGPNNIAILITAITDNRNRTLGEIRHVLQEHQGKLVGEGSVRWMFERQGGEWVPKSDCIVTPDEQTTQKLEELAEALDENDAVQEIYSATP
ncbi:MAG: YebC/PmpR family DNA-binding transcriptional regulator [Parcubacteria group bacterium]|nr:YebC/PmpR family DNA-binding transcriptional regulator [Parcubacteria group bacterium]MBI4217295.1 YebC/PmpR family DNA-binding transcriptional regulator [Parcubacteria group bacterium]